MRRESFLYSGLLHLVAILLAIFGLPIFMKEPPIDEQPIIVDIVPLGEKTNPPPKQLQTDPQPEPPKPEEKPQEQASAPPAKAAPPPPPPPEPPKPQPPAPTPPPPKPEPAPLPPPPKPPEPKPEPPKPVPPPPKPEPKPKQKPQEDLDSLFKSVDKLKPKANNDSKEKAKDVADLMKDLDKVKPSDKGNQPKPQNVKGSDLNNPNEPLSMTELDMIRAQLYKCWNPPAGAKEAKDLIVAVHVQLQPDGTVTSADIDRDGRYLTDSFYRAAADSARRAVLACSPLKAPPSKYDTWKDLKLRFNPKDLVGSW